MMSRRKHEVQVTKLVWRMDSAHPAGAFVDPSGDVNEADGPVASHDRGWLESSIELRHGIRMSETPLDALPDEVVDLFLQSRR